jgi:hypothetical protein
MVKTASKSRLGKTAIVATKKQDKQEEEESISTTDHHKQDAKPAPKVKQATPIIVDHHPVINFTRSNDPATLDAPPIMMTVADHGFDSSFGHGLGLIYPESKMRHFSYPVRQWKIVPWLRCYDQTGRSSEDPFQDLETLSHGRNAPHPLSFPVGKMDPREVKEYVLDSTRWFRTDYLSFYTHWSQRFVSHYDEGHDCFAFYTASGEMTTMYQWFQNSDVVDNSDLNVEKIVASIWKRMHPPSYFLYRQKKIDASKNPAEHGYNTATFRKMKVVFAGLPHTFSIMKKRVISIIAGDSSHFICYLAVNFGAHFKGVTPAADGEPCFIANIDSGNGGKGMNPFVQWLLAVIYELEVWVTQFLNTAPAVLITSPSLSEIGRRCKTMVKRKKHRVCQIPIPQVLGCPKQADGWNCGVFSVLNTRAVFLADLYHHVDWSQVIDVDSLLTRVLQPFWQLGTDPKLFRRRIDERVSSFRSNIVALMVDHSSGHCSPMVAGASAARALEIDLEGAANKSKSKSNASNAATKGGKRTPGDGSKSSSQSNSDSESSSTSKDERSAAGEANKSDESDASDARKSKLRSHTSDAGQSDENDAIDGSKSDCQSDTKPPVADVVEADAMTVISALDKDAVNEVSVPYPDEGSDSGSDSDLSIPIGVDPDKQHPDMTQDGKFFYQLKEKAELVASQTKRRRLRRARWLEQSEGMTYTDRQSYFQIKKLNREARHWVAGQTEREAKDNKKRKSREWREKSEEIQAVFRKPAKLLAKEKKDVARILNIQFAVNETTGEKKDEHVSQISHLKFIPKEQRPFTLAEKRAQRKVGQKSIGYEMNVLAYYQGLAYNKVGTSYLVDHLNPMWVRDCFEEPFVTLVKKIGNEETKSEVVLAKRKWIPVPIGNTSNRQVTPDVVVDVKVQYQQGEVKSCLFRSLASAFHHLGRKHTGSVLASIARKNEHLSADKQLEAAIAAVTKHETVYTKVDFWKKQKALARHDFIGKPNDNPKLLVLRGCDGGVQHAVSVVGSTIFDSNLKRGLPLSKESLDWCCNCNGGFSRVQSVVQFRK